MLTYFSPPSGAATRQAMREGLLGAILTRQQGLYKELEGVEIIVDNGKFGKGWKGGRDFLEFVDRVDAKYPGQVRFVVAPDVVGDAAATLAESLPYVAQIRAMGHKVAYAAQNGLTIGNAPWDSIDVLFLGGVPECLACAYVRPAGDRETERCPSCRGPLAEWKLSVTAAGLVAEAARRGIPSHGGRVNSRLRVGHMIAMGVTTADGTYVTNGPDENLPKVRGWFRSVARDGVQSDIFGSAA